jgi:lipopolysaccharide biosynthesis protein
MLEGTSLNTRKSICFFASYFKGEEIPYYIKVYLKELKSHFPELIFLVSNESIVEDDLSFLRDHAITLQKEKNEGYDFGMWYKAMLKYDILNYDEVALVNDSCVLFASLRKFEEWVATEKADVFGMTESYSVAHHLQSYFLWFRKSALPVVKSYFQKHGIQKDLGSVIKVYEIGLSSEILSEGLKIAPFVSNNDYKGEFAPYYHCIVSHLQQGIPLIKKKVVYASYRKDELLSLARMNFKIEVSTYFDIMAKSTDLIVDLNRLKDDQEFEFNRWDVLKYNAKRFFIHALRPIYQLVKRSQ